MKIKTLERCLAVAAALAAITSALVAVSKLVIDQAPVLEIEAIEQCLEK